MDEVKEAYSELWQAVENGTVDKQFFKLRETARRTFQERTWECYTLCEDDIKAVAERKGLSLEEKDLDDVIRQIKKGIQWGLDDVRDEIIEEAIISADDKK